MCKINKISIIQSRPILEVYAEFKNPDFSDGQFIKNIEIPHDKRKGDKWFILSVDSEGCNCSEYSKKSIILKYFASEQFLDKNAPFEFLELNSKPRTRHDNKYVFRQGELMPRTLEDAGSSIECSMKFNKKGTNLKYSIKDAGFNKGIVYYQIRHEDGLIIRQDDAVQGSKASGKISTTELIKIEDLSSRTDKIVLEAEDLSGHTCKKTIDLMN